MTLILSEIMLLLYVLPWSWATELIYGKLWMPAARFTTIYPDESGIADLGGGTGNTSYFSYQSTTDSYYSMSMDLSVEL